MNNNKLKNLNNKLEKVYYFSISYFLYNIIEIKMKKNSNKGIDSERIRKSISESMKYFFYFIDLIIIVFILIKNYINIFKTRTTIDKIVYAFIILMVIFTIYYCVDKINEIIVKENIAKSSKDLVEEIIECNNYILKNEKSAYVKTKKYIKASIVKISLKRTKLLGYIMIIIGIFSLQNKFVEIIILGIIILYFFMRPVHYYIVFYKDFKNKISKKRTYTIEEKNRYITLALLNYVKIILEFCILIYTLKYIGLAFIHIETNTFFELVYNVVIGNLEVKTSLEMVINLLRIASLGMVISLNLAAYMSLEVKDTIKT